MSLLFCRIEVKSDEFNSTFEIGICTNVLGNNQSYDHAGAVEYPVNGTAIIIGRYNESDIMLGSM